MTLREVHRIVAERKVLFDRAYAAKKAALADGKNTHPLWDRRDPIGLYSVQLHAGEDRFISSVE